MTIVLKSNDSRILKWEYGNMLIRSLLIIFTSVFLYASNVIAGIYYSHSLNIHNATDNAEPFSFNTMKNFICFGATVGLNGNIVIAQSVVYWTKDSKSGASGDTSKLTMLELGPRFIYYFDQSGSFSISAAYHPYAKGSRTLPSGSSETISGAGYFASISYQLRMSKLFYVGAAFVYHAVSINESTVEEETTTVSNSYTNYYPVLEFSLRFK